jgi:hypothetical protein
MSNTNTGGPAFPRAPFTYTDNNNGLDWAVREQSGMTLRDYFAAKASEADIAEYMPKTVGEATLQPYRTRQWARYKHADAMLKAREA